MKAFRHPSFFPAATSLLFAAAIVLGVLVDRELISEGSANWMAIGAKLLLALAFLFLGAWFLKAFTQCHPTTATIEVDAAERKSMFRFAYLFSLFSLALLVLPFVAMLRTHETTPDAGPIRLLRACVATPSAEPAASGRAASGPAASMIGGPVELCPDPMPASGTVIYPWLVAVGGVVAQPCDPKGNNCWAEGSAPPPGQRLPPMFKVTGGFVVPFYIVVFAYIGGIVNLTRRLPEYQKRSACDYRSTPTEPRLLTIEAREFVVFQLMQLLSSPFVAMVAYYALEPKSIASAVGLAFISGFSTEAVLLMIRGVVNGVRPETTKPISAVTTPSLRVKVQQGGKPAPKVRVELRRSETDANVLRSAETEGSGEVDFRFLEAGTLWVKAIGPSGGATSAPHVVELKAGQAESIMLTLG